MNNNKRIKAEKVYIVICSTCAYSPESVYGVFDKMKNAISYRNELNKSFKGYRNFEIINKTINQQKELTEWEKNEY